MTTDSKRTNPHLLGRAAHYSSGYKFCQSLENIPSHHVKEEGYYISWSHFLCPLHMVLNIHPMTIQTIAHLQGSCNLLPLCLLLSLLAAMKVQHFHNNLSLHIAALGCHMSCFFPFCQIGHCHMENKGTTCSSMTNLHQWGI